ncbi:hypothetical protein K488DRAFT_87904 [Vararia minispora EC-137]|uniref:Uncharacterized protein n=1 Tax=Vararia minispora EC-137 TaxID=1314806 RepID=A0ACB8QEQ4_9AGAM|nr:hypothetical protein K488DRAFT_87904 [Vararia minispora EC-137]
MTLCGDASPFDLEDACVRTLWSLVILALFLFVSLAVAAPKPVFLRRALDPFIVPLRPFLSLEQAEAYDANVPLPEPPDLRAPRPPLWRTLVLSGFAFMECLVWIFIGFLAVVQHAPTLFTARAFVASATWLYMTVRPVVFPTLTAPCDIFTLLLAHASVALLSLGGTVYMHVVHGADLPLPFTLSAAAVDATVILGLLVVVMCIPMGIPSTYAEGPSKLEGGTVSPEDYVTLWDWITFKWVWPLIKKGSHVMLNEDDVWDLGATMRSRPLFVQFTRTRGSSVLRRLLKANMREMIMEFVLNYISIALSYASPYFLQRILNVIGPTSENYPRAYIFALLMFLSQTIKVQTDKQYMWLGPRLASRIRSELMASIFDKALKRKDVSGPAPTGKVDELRNGRAGPKDKKDASTGHTAKTGSVTADRPSAGADIGEIVNLMASDANTIAMTWSALYLICGPPLDIAIAMTFLYQLLGWSAFAGVFVLLAAIAASSRISRHGVVVHNGLMAARDRRMGLLGELLSAIKFVKFFAWEDHWTGRVLEAREQEMRWLVKGYVRLNSILSHTLWTSTPVLVSVVAFSVYVLSGHELSIAKAFTAIALFQMIRQPLTVLPTWLMQLVQSIVALNRISAFLEEDEVDWQVSSLKAPPVVTCLEDRGAGETYDRLGIEQGRFRWNETARKGDGKGDGATPMSNLSDAESPFDSPLVSADGSKYVFELRDISVIFPEGKMTVVTGPTASGKTALLMALLGEMMTLDGRIVMRKDPSRVYPNGLTHTISYAAQTPWLRNQSIRDNILFGYPPNDARYRKVLEACALLPDLDVLEDGDATEVGARGVSLSGGQKARISLARAVYAPSKYVLLDDPLSAVDSHTARFLFEKLFCGELLQDRTVVLVTHHVNLVLPGAHYVVCMLDGCINAQGTISDLRAAGVLDDIAHIEQTEAGKKRGPAENAVVGAAQLGNESEATDRKSSKLVKEERQAGSVKWSIYKTYLQASSYWTWAVLAVLVTLAQTLVVGEKVWIKIWGEAYTTAAPASPNHGLMSLTTNHLDHSYANAVLSHVFPEFLARWPPSAQDRPLFYVAVYAGIGFGIATASVLSTTVQYTGALKASRKLFTQLLASTVGATMRWYDTTPAGTSPHGLPGPVAADFDFVGRMLNRFSKDIEAIDSSLPSSFQSVNASIASFLASVLTVTFVFPAFVAPAIVIGFVYYQLAVRYLNTGRDLRRMEANSRSQIFSGFSELLEGIVTMWYIYWMTNRWLMFNFDMIGAVIVLLTTLFALSGLVSAGTAGLCITSAMSFAMSVYWTCRFWTNLELDLNSVERIVEYLDLPQEPPAMIQTNRPPANWPSSTSSNLIVVDDLVVKYAPELQAVLHNVSFALKRGERVGLLGRTGSGKSTLAMSILRFVDPTSGRIIIDGIDITDIGIRDLRSRITFIPQDATLFSGTLRENLDPFHKHDDAECMDALRRVHLLTDTVSQSQASAEQDSRTVIRPPSPSTGASLPEGATDFAADTDSKAPISLNTLVSVGGTNFSQGQRQLIAMARALLRRSSIIVLDEATSSIDFATDAKIQKTIREELQGVLLLTVAHRLKTIIDYDRLIVLDKGSIAESDTPWNLLQKEGSIFRSLCMKSGSFAELEQIARTKAGAA